MSSRCRVHKRSWEATAFLHKRPFGTPRRSGKGPRGLVLESLVAVVPELATPTLIDSAPRRVLTRLPTTNGTALPALVFHPWD